MRINILLEVNSENRGDERRGKEKDASFMIFLVSIRDIMAGMSRREEMMISEGILPGGVPSIERYERGKRGRGERKEESGISYWR